MNSVGLTKFNIFASICHFKIILVSIETLLRLDKFQKVGFLLAIYQYKHIQGLISEAEKFNYSFIVETFFLQTYLLIGVFYLILNPYV